MDWMSFGPDDLRKGRDAIDLLIPLTGLSDAELRSMKLGAIAGFIERMTADDIVSEDEEARMNELASALEMSQEDFDTGVPADLMNRIVVAQVNDGRLPVLPASSLVVKKNEMVHFEVPAQLMKEVTLREFRGGYQGVSVPLGHGVRYRVGGARGRSVVVGTQLQVADSGVLVASSSRAVFIGNRKSLEFRYDKLLSLNAYQDAIELHVSNRQAASLLSLAATAVDPAVAIIQAAAARFNN